MIVHWLNPQSFMRDIPSQMHPSPITLWWIIYNFHVIFTFNKKQSSRWFTKVNMTYVSRMFDSPRYIRCSTLWFLNPLEYLPVQFSSRLLLWLATLTFTFSSIYCTGQIWLTCLCIFKLSVLVFCRNSTVWF